MHSFHVWRLTQFHNKNRMKSIIKLIVFFSIWVVMVLVELSYRHPLFDESLVWIKEIQNHTTA